MIRYALLYGAYVGFLHLVDGPWRSWKSGRKGAVDPWTLQHVLWGGLARYMGLTLRESTILSTVNELGEAIVRQARPDLLWGSPESKRNVALDLLATAGGYILADAVL